MWCLALASLRTEAQVGVWTYHNNNLRTGLNTNETILNLTNVTSTRFGKLLTYPVDGCVYAQPLYMPNVNIPGQGTHNVIYIATENATVYAFDADNGGASGGQLWKTNLGAAAVTTTATYTNKSFGTRYNGGAYTDIVPQVGSTGTPVIDTNSGTLYVDVFTGIVSGGVTNYYHYLHALNITNGTDTNVLVTASVAGTGVDSVAGRVTFNAKQENQRCALTLSGGIVYISYAGYADTDPYHGWIIGFSTTNLTQLTNYVFNTTPNATTSTYGANAAEGGLWMGGDGLCVDNNSNLYFMVGNGSFSATNNSGKVDYGDSFMKLTTTNGLAVADYFTPWDQATLQSQDSDLGSGGLMLLPDQTGNYPHEMLGAGKQGQIFVVNRDQFTTGNNHYDQNNVFDFIVQTNLGQIGASFDTPAYFNGRIYYAAQNENLKAISVTNGALANNVILSDTARTYPNKGSTPSISASGTNNGIVWTIQMPTSLGAAATLVACNATNFTTELYNSGQASGNRDLLGAGVKFNVPTVADGEVIVGTSNSVSVFGLLSGTFSFNSTAYSVKETVTNLTITVNRLGGTNGAAQVSYATVAGGTAVNGVDYTAVSGLLNWTNGETVSKSFTVPVLGNSLERSNLTVNLALSNPTNTASALGTQSAAVLTINLSTPIVSTPLSATAITYGQTLASSTLGGTFTNTTGVAIAGTLVFVNSGIAPLAGTTNVLVSFTPTDTADYNTVTNTVSVTVNKETPVVATPLSATAITYGQTLASSTPSGSFTNVADVSVPGSLGFVNSSIAPKAGITNVLLFFTPTDTADYNYVTNTVSVTVNLATPILLSAPTATAITYGQTLASSTPSGSFTNGSGATVPGVLAFVNPTWVPKAGNTNVQVSFTPTDATDYNDVTNTVSVTVKLATPILSSAPTATAITYGQTLASSTVSGATFTNLAGTAVLIASTNFVTPAIEPLAGVTNVQVYFVPLDVADYNNVTNTVSVTVNKGTPILSGVLSASEITYGQTLANSTPSGSFTNVAGVSVPGTLGFVNLSIAPKAGVTNVSLFFAPTDTADYNYVTNTVSVTVNLATPVLSSAVTATAITYGQTLASSTPSGSFTNGLGAIVPGVLSFVNPTWVPKAGTTNVQVSFTPTDAADYNNVTNTVSVTVNKGTPVIATPLIASAITYGQTLASSTVTGATFTNLAGTAVLIASTNFVTPAIVPLAGVTNVQVYFVPVDVADYNNETNTVGVTVSKATPLLGGTLAATAITYGQSLASSTPSGSFTNGAGAAVPGLLAFVNPALVPKAGTTNVQVSFTPSDTADYNIVTNTVSVTVNLVALQFTGLSSLTNTYGVTSIILSGDLSGSGPAYPSIGEVVTATINGFTVGGTVTNSTGAFWINFNDPSLATNDAAGSPYAITYGYAGNAGNGLASAADISTTLTIIQPPNVTWKLTYFGTNAGNPAIAGDSADPTHDGIANLLAYAYAFNPTVTNANPFVGDVVGGKFLLSFPRNTTATDITYLVQASENLSIWSNLLTYTVSTGWVTNQPGTGVSESPTNGVPPGQYVNVTVTGSTNVAATVTNRFLRLQIHR